MGTYYIPNENGWGAQNSSRTKVRIQVTTSYNKNTNKSTVTIMPQAMANGDYVINYSMGNTSHMTANGSTLIAATGSDDSWNGYSFNLSSSGWVNLSGTSGFSLTVNHDDDGNATVSVSIYFRIFNSAQGEYRTWNNSDSVSWQEERLRDYILILSAGPGSTVTVTRGGVAVQNGATIRENEVLTVNFGATAGYVLDTHTVNGVTTESGSTVTVAGNVTAAATATAIPYALSINAGTGSEITVQRISSPKQGATLGALTDGAPIYDGDVLRATAEAASGYVLTSATLNGKPIPENHTVNSNVTVSATAEEYVDPGEHYTLTISTDPGASATVIRANEKLISGAVLAAGDVLSVYFAPETGYVLETSTVNGAPFVSGGTITVSNDVSVAATAIEEKKVSVTVGDLWHSKPTFFQWETDRVLVISGTEKAPFLRFANCAISRALVVKAEYSGSDWLCKVPNIMLQFAGDMVVSVVVEEDTGETREIASAAYRVKPRVKPQDYEYTENIGYINWVEKSAEAERLLEQLRIAAGANATAADSAAQAADSALDARTQASFAGEAAADAKEQKEAAADSAAAAALSATQAADSAAAASGDKTDAERAARSARASAADAEAARESAEDDAFSASQYAGYANIAKTEAQTAQTASEEAASAAAESAESAEEAAAHYPRIVDGKWQVWDPENQVWTSTGVKAQGPQGPEGYPGETGATGATPDMQIGMVSTLDAGQPATANMTGTPEKPLLNLGIPKGDKGDTGAKGEKGEKGDPGEVTQTEFDELSGDVSNLKSTVDYIKNNVTNDISKAYLYPSYMKATINNDGTLNTSGAGQTTDLLPVSPGELLTLNSKLTSKIAYYKKDGSFISPIISITTGLNDYIVPNEAAFARYQNVYSGGVAAPLYVRRKNAPINGCFFDLITSPIKQNPNIEFTGDSNTVGYGLSSNEKSWANLIIEELNNITTFSYGINNKWVEVIGANSYSSGLNFMQYSEISIWTDADSVSIGFGATYSSAWKWLVDGVESGTASSSSISLDGNPHKVTVAFTSGQAVDPYFTITKTFTINNNALSGSGIYSVPITSGKDWLVIMIGTNDRNKLIGDIGGKYMQYHGKGTYIVPFPNHKTDPIYTYSQMQLYSSLIEGFASYGYEIVNLNDVNAFAFFDDSYYQADKIHYNANGHKLIANMISGKMGLPLDISI